MISTHGLKMAAASIMAMWLLAQPCRGASSQASLTISGTVTAYAYLVPRDLTLKLKPEVAPDPDGNYATQLVGGTTLSLSTNVKSSVSVTCASELTLVNDLNAAKTLPCTVTLVPSSYLYDWSYSTTATTQTLSLSGKSGEDAYGINLGLYVPRETWTLAWPGGTYKATLGLTVSPD